MIEMVRFVNNFEFRTDGLPWLRIFRYNTALTGDFFARARDLPKSEEGDLLAILDAGAYGMALASNYNTRPRPAEVLVDGKSVKLIRRRETMADLLRSEL